MVTIFMYVLLCM